MIVVGQPFGFLRVGLNGHLGVRPANVPTGGDVEAILIDTFDLPDDAEVELVPVVVDEPLQGDFALRSDGSYVHGPITGSDPWTYRLYYHRPGDATITDGGLATITDTGGSDVIADVSGAGGIASGEAFGTPTVVGEAPYSVSGAGGIESGEAFGVPTVGADGVYSVSDAGGIASGEAFGVPTVAPAGLYSVSGAGGIASGEAFGVPTVSADGVYSVSDAGGIASGEAFGSPTVAGTFPGGTGATAAEIAEAVWTRLIEGGITAEQWLRIVAAPLSGTASGIGTGTERYKSRDGTKDRVVATFDSSGNRTTVTVDGS